MPLIWFRHCLAALCICFGLFPAAVAAQEQAAVESAESVSAEPSTAAADTSIDDPARDEQRRQSALAGMMILALVCVVFLTLIMLVIVWSRRIRRLVKTPLPGQHPGDPLWYLRRSPPDPASTGDQQRDDP